MERGSSSLHGPQEQHFGASIICCLRDCQNSQLKPHTLPLFIFCIFFLAVSDLRPKVHEVFNSCLSVFPGPHVLYSLLVFFLLLLILAPQTHCQQQENKNLFFFTGCYCMFTPPQPPFTQIGRKNTRKNCGNQGKIIKKELKEHNRSSPGNAALWQCCKL